MVRYIPKIVKRLLTLGVNGPSRSCTRLSGRMTSTRWLAEHRFPVDPAETPP